MFVVLVSACPLLTCRGYMSIPKTQKFILYVYGKQKHSRLPLIPCIIYRMVSPYTIKTAGEKALLA